MNVKRTAKATVIVVGLAASSLALVTGSASAVPLDPPPSPISPAPGQPPDPGQIALPQAGGSTHGGHALPQQPPPGTP